MKSDEIITLVEKCDIFDGKKLSFKQKEIAIRYVFGQTAEELAMHFDNSTRSIWLHLDVVRNEFGNVSLSLWWRMHHWFRQYCLIRQHIVFWLICILWI